MPSATTIISNALLELNQFKQGESIPAEDLAFGLSKLNRMIDQWNIAKRLIPFTTFNQYTLTANHQPHTIGPSAADFAATVRPAEIRAAQLVLTSSSPNTGIPLAILDDAQWAAQQVKALTSTIPTALFYSPEFPNGKIYLWPVPTDVNKLELEVAGILTSFADLGTNYTLAPGYEEAITLALALKLAGPFSATVTPVLVEDHRKAMAFIEANNSKSPRIATTEAGQKSKRAGRADFNWQTGNITQ